MIVALTHAPSPRMDQAVRTHTTYVPIDLARANAQHAGYRAMLEAAGATVRVLEGNAEHPDAVFVEDAAIVLDELAIVASMGAPSRSGELDAIAKELARWRDEIATITTPATIEGGDVLRVGRKLLVGLSARTNGKGVAALAEAVRPHGYVVVPVRVTGCLHLKTACTALPDGTLLLNPKWLDLGALTGFPLLGVHDDEPHAANVLLVGDVVCTGEASPGTVAELRRRGLDVRTTALDELAKADGCTTCMSLVFDAP